MPQSTLRISVDENEMGLAGKIVAGVLLSVFTLLPIYFLIGLWPNDMPNPEDPGLYSGKLFAISKNNNGTLHINTILFLLSALAGFTGSMIHIGTSLTNYVGSGKFKRNWILWYCIKPFTAAAVAMLFFLVLKAGLLNFDGAAGANPFGIVILSALAGLFTDKATMKLEEIFTVIFKPKDERPHKMDENSITIKGFTPKQLNRGAENVITLSGEGFDKHKLVFKIGDATMETPEIKADSVVLKYKVPENAAADGSLPFVVLDDSGKVLLTDAFTLEKLTAAAASAAATTDGLQSATNNDNLPDDDEVEELAETEAFVKG